MGLIYSRNEYVFIVEFEKFEFEAKLTTIFSDEKYADEALNSKTWEIDFHSEMTESQKTHVREWLQRCGESRLDAESIYVPSNNPDWDIDVEPTKLYEICPSCDLEQELELLFVAHSCPNCGKQILPCSICDILHTPNGCSTICPFEHRDQERSGNASILS